MNTKKSLLLLVLFPTLFAVSLQGMVDPEALFAAAHEGNVETINALIVKGADVNAQDETDGRTALMGAARKGYVDAIKALIAKGADVNITNNIGRTVLMIAAGNGHVGAIEALIAKGADVKAKDNRGWTALKHAAQYNEEAEEEEAEAKIPQEVLERLKPKS